MVKCHDKLILVARVEGSGMTTKSMSEFEFILSLGNKLGEYVDEWIAVAGNKIVARGLSAKEVFDKAKEISPSKTPFIMKVPADKVMVL